VAGAPCVCCGSYRTAVYNVNSYEQTMRLNAMRRERRGRAVRGGATRRKPATRRADVILSLRVPADVAKRIRRLAEAEDRPVGAYLRRLVLQALAALEREKPES